MYSDFNSYLNDNIINNIIIIIWDISLRSYNL